MRIGLEKGDKITLHPAAVLLRIFTARNFFLNDDSRITVAGDLGDKTGTVTSIEDKYAYDYFFFLPDGNEPHNTYSIPYEAVDFNALPKTL